MLRSLLISWALMAAAFAITAWLLSGLEISGGFGSYLWIALLFGVINAVIGTFLRIITLPLTILTLGLFSIVVNAVLLNIIDAISSRLTIDSFFWTAIWAALILSFVSVCLQFAASASPKPEFDLRAGFTAPAFRVPRRFGTTHHPGEVKHPAIALEACRGERVLRTVQGHRRDARVAVVAAAAAEAETSVAAMTIPAGEAPRQRRRPRVSRGRRRPVHRVSLAAFGLAPYAVTNAEFRDSSRRRATAPRPRVRLVVRLRRAARG